VMFCQLSHDREIIDKTENGQAGRQADRDGAAGMIGERYRNRKLCLKRALE